MNRMKAVKIAAALAIVMAVAAFVVAEDKPFFDMKNCAMCSTLASKPGLLEAMTWEHFPISNGVMQVGHCPDEHKADFGQAMAEMGKVQEKMKAGEAVTLDGYCMTFGELLGAGAKMEHFDAAHSSVTLITSTDPKMVEKIHAFAAKTNEELKKMAAASAEAPAETK
jgi:hypothetical protein